MKLCSWLIPSPFLVLLLISLFLRPAQATPLNPPTAPVLQPANLLQFKVGEHIIGFQPDRVYLAGLNHALSMKFVAAAGTRPHIPASVMTGGQGGALDRVTYANMWPGITVSYEAAAPGGIAKSTYTVAPGADPAQIRLRYNVPVELLTNGALRFAFATGYLTESAPLAWQVIAGRRVPVTVTFRLVAGVNPGDVSVSFALGAYNPRYPLVIDPAYAWHAFYGGSDGDGATGIAVDTGGNIYIAGGSSAAWVGPGNAAPLNPYTAGSDDIVVVKLNSSGVYQWHTFYGSDGLDSASEIAVDNSSNVYLTGYSKAAWSGPGGTSPLNSYTGDYDILVVKLNSNGAYRWHTFYGSSSGWDRGNSIVVDASNIYITGASNATWSGPGGAAPLNPYTGDHDILVVKLNSNGAYQWHTFYGSSSLDIGGGIAVDAGSSVYIVGSSTWTWSGPGRIAPLNAHTGYYDILVVKLSSSGVYQWHTFYGGTGQDRNGDIAVDASGAIYVAGISNAAWSGPGSVAPLNAHTGYNDFFAVKLDSEGAYQWHTFHGSSHHEWNCNMAVDIESNIYISGVSEAAWVGEGSAAPLNPYTGLDDIVAVKLNSSGNYQWHTFYGSNQIDRGNNIAVNSSGDVYAVGLSRAAWNGPDGAAPLTPYNRGEQDMVIVKINDLTPVALSLTKSVSPSSALPGQAITYTLTFSNAGGDTATGVILTDIVPVSVTNVSVSSSGAAITATGSVSFTWQVQDLAPKQGGIITLTGQVSPTLTWSGRVTNTAMITGTDVEVGIADNTAVAGLDISLPVLTFERTAYSVAEVAGSTVITLSLSRALEVNTAVELHSSDGSATVGRDYPTVDQAITIPAGRTVITFTAVISDDTTDEADETVNLMLENPVAAQLGVPATAVLTIIDDDSAGVIVSPTNLTIVEPAGHASFNLYLTSQPTATVTINLASSDTGECTVPALAAILPVEWQTGVTVTVNAVNDNLNDGPQSCLVQLLPTASDDSHYQGLDPADVEVIIIDKYGIFLPIILKAPW